ncbi:hypothetical protein SCHPADRAFT_263160 [Schizopora paradoxa]|uniref:Uncharacterized protein n=1 Tax=Schizopora paradoxa TaxID=27342 RepID=A0A0H2SEL3_9AGAM|nr:hypothetical protein SCHPADRAFT_263160 [Schizopora paradoxa]
MRLNEDNFSEHLQMRSFIVRVLFFATNLLAFVSAGASFFKFSRTHRSSCFQCDFDQSYLVYLGTRLHSFTESYRVEARLLARIRRPTHVAHVKVSSLSVKKCRSYQAYLARIISYGASNLLSCHSTALRIAMNKTMPIFQVVASKTAVMVLP